MSMRYPGGLIATTPVNQQFPSGVWTGAQSAPYQSGNVWAYDSSFKNTTLLLHGDGATRSFTQDASTNNFQLSVVGDTKPNNLTPFITNGYWSNLFNGSSGVTVSSTSSQFGFSGDFTWEAWINLASLPSSGGNYSIICSRGSVASNSAFQFLIGNSSGTYQITGTISISSSDSNLVWNISGTPSIGTWYHVAIVRSGTSVQAYWNGTAIGSAQTASGTTNTPTVNPTIGFRGGSYNDLFFNGYISNFRMVGSAVYTGNFTPSTTPLTAISGTRILTCQSNRFVDNSTNGFTLTAYSAPAVSMQQPFTAPSGTSLYGSGYFDGTGDYITTPTGQTPLILGTSDFTIEMWAYPTTQVRGNPSLFTSDPGIGLANAILVQFSGTTGQTVLWVNNTNLTASSTTNYIVLNQWNHVAVVRSGGSTYALYINGVAVNNVATNSTSLTTSNWYIGYWTVADNAYTGNISNFRIVNGTAVYTGAFTPPTAPLTPITNTALLTLQTNGPATNNGFLDSSYNSFPVTRNGNTTQGSFSPYGTNWSNYFDGSSHLTTAASASLQAGTGAFTIEGWINIVGTTTSGSILSQAPDVAGGYGVALVYSSGANTLSGVITTTSTPSWSASITPVKGVWYHVALVRDASTNIALFINGVKITPTTGGSTNTTNITAFNYFVSGSYFPDNPSRVNFRLNGYVSNARFVKGSAVYDPTAASITVPTAQLTAVTNTQLLILQANRIYDGSSNAFAITYSGTQSIGRFSPFPASLQYGTQPVGGSGYFDGTTDFLTVPKNTALEPATSGAWTLETWVYITSTSMMRVVAYANSTISSGPDLGYYLTFYSANYITGGFYSSTTQYDISSSSTVAQINTWIHIALTSDGSTMRLFVNGVSSGTPLTVSGIAINAPSSATFKISNYSSSQYVTGYVTDTRFVKGTAVYTSNFTPPTAPLTAITNTSLLLSYTNAAIFDNSGIGNLETVGDAKVSTAVTKYGTGSMYFDGSGDWLIPSANSSLYTFGTGDFTIEFWLYIATTQTSVIYDSRPASTQGLYPELYLASNQINYYQSSAIAISGAVLANATWYHIALCRNGTSTRLFVNGTQVGSTYSDSNNYVCGANRPIIGTSGYDNLGPFNGYLDDLRITKGVARYVTNFTPPVARMPNQ